MRRDAQTAKPQFKKQKDVTRWLVLSKYTFRHRFSIGEDKNVNSFINNIYADMFFLSGARHFSAIYVKLVCAKKILMPILVQ